MAESREELRELLIQAADAETSIGPRMAGLVVDAQLAALAEAGVAMISETCSDEMAAAGREALREGGLLPSYTDTGGPGQPPFLHHLLKEKAWPAMISAGKAGRIDKP